MDHFAPWLAANPDPLPVVYEIRTRAENRHRMHVGMSPEGWVLTPPETSLLALGPPRSNGKTSGVLVATVLTAPGPAVVTSTKRDLIYATAVARGRLGRLLHFSPTGDSTPPGVQRVKWSPIAGSKDPDQALLMGERMAMTTKGGENHQHFASKAGDLLAVLFHYADTHDLPMEWAVETVNNQDLAALADIAEELADTPNKRLGSALRGILLTDSRERGSFFTTAVTALRPYYFEAALESARDHDFDPMDFVSGRPGRNHHMNPAEGDLLGLGIRPNGPKGTYDTLYITGDSEDQQGIAPIIVALLADIRKHVVAMHREDEELGRRNRRPVTFVLDELYTMAPLPALPKMLSDGGSQGLFVAGALQDLSQAADKWGTQITKGFLTLFQNVAVLPGIREEDALRLISLLAGDDDRTTTSGSVTLGAQGRSVSHNFNNDRIPKLPASVISAGHPASPDLFVYLEHGGRWSWIYNTPYFRSVPWVQLLVSCMEYALANLDTLPPFPDLAKNGDYNHLYRAGGQPLIDRYWAALTRRAER